MDSEKINILISLGLATVTTITSINGIKSYKNQKRYEKNELALKEFYIPLFQKLEKHLYKFDADNSDFKKTIKFISTFFRNKYIYVPFLLQITFNNFLDEPAPQKYNKFCDCFLNLYSSLSRACNTKPLTTHHRNMSKWYKGFVQRIFFNLKDILNFLYYLVVILTIWLVAMSILYKIFMWVNV